jgi:uncharacterized protein (DUF2235 family)
MKNIVICCDGTGNEISENISNVLKLYRCLRKTGKAEPHQVVFYDPGLGTLARPDPWKKWWRDASAIFGLITGYGLDDNVLGAYEFLARNYEEGDDIYLFGFSRGAYTVRVLAGLIHKAGLVDVSQINLAGSGLTAYKQVSAGFEQRTRLLEAGRLADGAGQDPAGPVTRDDQAAQFGRILSVKWPTVTFVGVWDTVASVIVPRPDRFYCPSFEQLAYTRENPSVRIFRQAISIDERRRMFRLQPWEQKQIFMSNRFSGTHNAAPQDALQVWFAGVHGDIGGGYPEKESALSKYPLLWMIGEAVKCGLAVNPATVNQLAWGRQRQGSPFSYVAPDFMGAAHDSMSPGWRLLEYLPRADKYREWQARKSYLGWYIPHAEPRVIPQDAFIHESAVQKIRQDPNYRPVNMPARYQVIPMLDDPREHAHGGAAEGGAG